MKTLEHDSTRRDQAAEVVAERLVEVADGRLQIGPKSELRAHCEAWAHKLTMNGSELYNQIEIHLMQDRGAVSEWDHDREYLAGWRIRE